tara:strand:+ start:1564 stop:1698 length:135 start_codon:yes stop_codon:yes gene_type:complete
MRWGIDQWQDHNICCSIQGLIDVYHEHITIDIESGSNNDFKALP